MIIGIVENNSLDDNEVMPVDLGVGQALFLLIFLLLLLGLFLVLGPLGPLAGPREYVELVVDVALQVGDTLLLSSATFSIKTARAQ